MKDIVITGMGATTPLGGDLASTWQAMLAGESGIVRIPEQWADEIAVKIAGYVKVDPSEKIDRVKARRLDRNTQLALIAAEEAWLDAGLSLGEDNPIDPETLDYLVVAHNFGELYVYVGEVARVCRLCDYAA